MGYFKQIWDVFRRIIPKESATDRRIKKDRSGNHYTAPRSMTQEEKDYYEKHKHLNGLYKS